MAVRHGEGVGDAEAGRAGVADDPAMSGFWLMSSVRSDGGAVISMAPAAWLVPVGR
jgi:hypothetical protein